MSYENWKYENLSVDTKLIFELQKEHFTIKLFSFKSGIIGKVERPFMISFYLLVKVLKSLKIYYIGDTFDEVCQE